MPSAWGQPLVRISPLPPRTLQNIGAKRQCPAPVYSLWPDGVASPCSLWPSGWLTTPAGARTSRWTPSSEWALLDIPALEIGPPPRMPLLLVKMSHQSPFPLLLHAPPHSSWADRKHRGALSLRTHQCLGEPLPSQPKPRLLAPRCRSLYWLNGYHHIIVTYSYPLYYLIAPILFLFFYTSPTGVSRHRAGDPYR